MLGHASFGVSDLARSVAFYDAALGALGYVRVWSAADAAGWGRPGGEDEFAVKQRSQAAPPGPGFHLAFTAPSRAAVGEFHVQALAQGGRDLGGPGPRPHYGPTYYAAFVADPDGYAIEAVHQ